MHEWALAEGIVSTAEKLSEDEGFSELTEMEVKVGKLQRADPGILKKAIEDLIEGKDLFETTEIKIDGEMAILECRNCGNKWSFSGAKQKLEETELEAIHFLPETVHSYTECPRCGSSDFKVKKGRGTWLARLRGKK